MGDKREYSCTVPPVRHMWRFIGYSGGTTSEPMKWNYVCDICGATAEGKLVWSSSTTTRK